MISPKAIADGATPNQQVAINAAIVEAWKSGTCNSVLLEAGGYVINEPIQILPGVSLVGDGIVLAHDTNGIEYRYNSWSEAGYAGDFTQGQGRSLLCGITLLGVEPSASRKAVLQPGSEDNRSGILYGLTIRDAIINNFDIAISARNTNFVTIDNVWAQWVNQGLDLRGPNYNWQVGQGTKIVKADGVSGSAKRGLSWGSPETAVLADVHNFTVNGGALCPEGLNFDGFWTNGLASSFILNKAGFVGIDSGNLQSCGQTFVLSNVYGGFYLRDSYVEIDLPDDVGAAVISILDPGSPVGNESILIDGNTFISGSNSNAFIPGIYVAANHRNVMIHRNRFENLQNGFGQAYAIDVAAPDQCSIRDNVSVSSKPLGVSILLGTCIPGSRNDVTHNDMAGAFGFVGSDVSSGALAHSRNIFNGTPD